MSSEKLWNPPGKKALYLGRQEKSSLFKKQPEKPILSYRAFRCEPSTPKAKLAQHKAQYSAATPSSLPTESSVSTRHDNHFSTSQTQAVRQSGGELL
jgi:hypothetical protein